jgi:DNA modification methylase
MRTQHSVFFQNSKQMTQVPTESIDLVVTSSPYPLIEMWDDQFANEDNEVEQSLRSNDGTSTFELMHLELDQVWVEVARVLKTGGMCCVNIGDAVRTIGTNFQLYPNHARILNTFSSLGLTVLPEIIWRKPTNAPNKFMGSGMLPPSAYVTLEHEFILILRKGGKRVFKTEKDKINRRTSAYFWEERNKWFSDIWDLRGVSQSLFDKNTKDLRARSAAFPFELAYRLINMYSVKNDVILDPFLGTGTTTLGAMVSARNSIGFEIEQELKFYITERFNNIIDFGNSVISNRLQKHKEFITSRLEAGKEIKHQNRYYEFPVITRQEEELFLNTLQKISHIDNCTYKVEYNEHP